MRKQVITSLVGDLDISRHPLDMSAALRMRLASSGARNDIEMWRAADEILADAIRGDAAARAIHDEIVRDHSAQIGHDLVSAAYRDLRSRLCDRLVELGHVEHVALDRIAGGTALAA